MDARTICAAIMSGTKSRALLAFHESNDPANEMRNKQIASTYAKMIARLAAETKPAHVIVREILEERSK